MFSTQDVFFRESIGKIDLRDIDVDHKYSSFTFFVSSIADDDRLERLHYAFVSFYIRRIAACFGDRTAFGFCRMHWVCCV